MVVLINPLVLNSEKTLFVFLRRSLYRKRPSSAHVRNPGSSIKALLIVEWTQLGVNNGFIFLSQKLTRTRAWDDLWRRFVGVECHYWVFHDILEPLASLERAKVLGETPLMAALFNTPNRLLIDSFEEFRERQPSIRQVVPGDRVFRADFDTHLLLVPDIDILLESIVRTAQKYVV